MSLELNAWWSLNLLSSHDLSSVLVGLWNNKCNLKRQSKFKSPYFIKQFTLNAPYSPFTTPHAPTAEISLSFCSRLSFFYANNWSRNIIIIEFITFLIFFASQYFSFTLFRTTHDIIPPHKTWKFPCFFLFFAGFYFVLWFHFCNICRSMCVHAVYENIFTGKTLNNFFFLLEYLFLLWYRKLLHIVSLLWGEQKDIRA